MKQVYKTIDNKIRLVVWLSIKQQFARTKDKDVNNKVLYIYILVYRYREVSYDYPVWQNVE